MRRPTPQQTALDAVRRPSPKLNAVEGGFLEVVAIAVPLRVALYFWFRSRVTYVPDDEGLTIGMPFYKLTILYEDIRSVSLLKNSFDDFRLGKTLSLFKLGAGDIIKLEKGSGFFRFVYLKPELADDIVLRVTAYNRSRGRAISDVVNEKRQTRRLRFTEPAA